MTIWPPLEISSDFSSARSEDTHHQGKRSRHNSTVTVSASEKIGHLNTNIMSTVTNYSENKGMDKIIIKTQEKFKKQYSKSTQKILK